MIVRFVVLGMILTLMMGCQPPKPIKIGFLATLSGPSAALGTGARRALEMRVRQINAMGGLSGQSLELQVEDDQGEPNQAVRGFETLADEGVSAVIGPMTSSLMAALLPRINQRQIVTISPTVSTVAVSGMDDWFFRVIVSNPAMGELLAQHALSQGYKEVAVLRETSNDAYTRPIWETVRTTLTQAGVSIRDPVEYDSHGHPDFERLAAKLVGSPAYLVLTNGYDAAQVGQALARHNDSGHILSPAWTMTNDLIELGGRQVERMVFASIYDSQSDAPLWRQFREDYQAVYRSEPGLGEVYASDALSLLLDAWSGNPGSSGQELRNRLKASGVIHGLQSDFHLDDHGDVVRDLFLLTVRDGHFVRYGR